MGQGAREFELKFAGAPGDVAALPDSLFMRAIAPGGGAWERLASTYYDTPASLLQGNRLSLRLREESGIRIQAVKRPKNGAAIDRTEYEREIKPGDPFPAMVGEAEVDALLHLASDHISPIAATTVDRWSHIASYGASRIEIAVDLGRAESWTEAGAHVEAPLAEVELELIEGDPKDVFDLGRLLLANAPLRLSVTTKLGMARSLADGGPYAIGDAERLQLAPEQTAGAVLTHALAGLAARISSLAPVILEARKVEGVHQMRVSLRRLRAIERTFRPFVDGSSLRDLAFQAKLIARCLGPARDWDVFVEETLPAMQENAYAAEGAAQLMASASAARARAWAEAVRAVGGKAFARFMIDLAEAASGPQWERAAALQRPIGEIAPLALEKRLKRARKIAAEIDRTQLAGWHPLRIALKKLRYPLQMFRSLYPKEARKPYMSALSTLQDAFGHINDAATAQRLADEAATGEGGNAMRAAGFICGYKAAEAEAAARQLEAEWAAFVEMTPFWRD